MNYSVNIDLDDYSKKSIEDTELDSLRDSTVIVKLDNESNAKLYEYYCTVKNLIVNNNKVVVLLDGDKSRIRKQICMLMVSYNKYDIYRLEDFSIVDNNYISTILNRNPGFEEVETFIDKDVASGGKVNELLTEISSNITKGNFEDNNKLLAENINIVESVVNTMDYMRQVTDASSQAFNNTVGKLRADLKSKDAEIEEKEHTINDSKFKINQLKNSLTEANEEVSKYKKLANTASNTNAALIKYDTIDLLTRKVRVGSILYFKEISKLRYINTFVDTLVELLSGKERLRVKLLIYDNNSNFNIYKPLNCVDARGYNEQKDLFLSDKMNKKVVVVEPASFILNDMVNCDYDVLIIYDRLRMKDDLVKGAIVTKYYVVSSKNEFENLKNDSPNIPNSDIIGPPEIGNGIIGIPEVDKKHLSTSKSLVQATYMRIENPCVKGQNIVNSIFERINVRELKNR